MSYWKLAERKVKFVPASRPMGYDPVRTYRIVMQYYAEALTFTLSNYHKALQQSELKQ